MVAPVADRAGVYSRDHERSGGRVRRVVRGGRSERGAVETGLTAFSDIRPRDGRLQPANVGPSFLQNNMLMRSFSMVLAAVGSLLATVRWRQPPVKRTTGRGPSPDVLMRSELVKLYCPSRGQRQGCTRTEAGH
jgi:hypothetical protein